MTDQVLPYGRQTIEDDDIAAVAEALRADFLTTGPRVEAFERAFAQTVGAPHAVACANGTAALHLAMLALEVQPGEVCIAPSITFLATANCARFVGAEVIFADVDPLTGLMTPHTLADALARASGRRVRAVLPVHLRGDVAELPALQVLAEQAGAVLVEDAPHALGSTMTFAGRREQVGDCRHSAMATFSFHPVKTIATGEGGMVTTGDARLAERLRTLRSHGMVRPAGAEPWWYEMPELGFNYRLPDILCALGLSQLSKLDRFAARRRHHLQSDRQSRCGEAAGQRQCRTAYQRDGVDDAEPLDVVIELLAVAFGDVAVLDREGRHNGRGRQQQVVLLEELQRPCRHRHALRFGSLELFDRQLQSFLDVPDHLRLELVAL
jgi:dTDP-4-amino-4,6-dideoxygalactose transaminase